MVSVKTPSSSYPFRCPYLWNLYEKVSPLRFFDLYILTCIYLLFFVTFFGFGGFFLFCFTLLG